MEARHFSFPEHCGCSLAVSITLAELGKRVTSFTTAWTGEENKKRKEIKTRNEKYFFDINLIISSFLKAFFDFYGNFSYFLHNFGFVERQEPAVFHNYFTVNDHRIDVGAVRGINKM